MRNAKENFSVFTMAVAQLNGSLKYDALEALAADGIQLTDRASLTRRQIPARAVSFFGALVDGLSAGDGQAVKRATDQLGSCGLSVRIDSKVRDRLAFNAGAKQLAAGE